jgi:hypothetical protein
MSTSSTAACVTQPSPASVRVPAGPATAQGGVLACSPQRAAPREARQAQRRTPWAGIKDQGLNGVPTCDARPQTEPPFHPNEQPFNPNRTAFLPSLITIPPNRTDMPPNRIDILLPDRNAAPFYL